MVNSPQSMEVQVWPIDKLVFYARNPRKNDAAVDRMCSSTSYRFRWGLDSKRRGRPSPQRANPEVVCHGMRKKVVPLVPSRAQSCPPVTKSCSRILIQVGARRYAMDIPCAATALPPDPSPPARPARVETLEVQTRFVRLSKPAILGDRIDGWRVCWLGGWDKGKVFFVVMVERVVRRALDQA